MTDKKELKQEQLDKVSGGTDIWAPKYADEYTREITTEEVENHIGEMILFVEKEEQTWFLGTLISCREECAMCKSNMVYHVEIYERSDGNQDLLGDRYYATPSAKLYVK